MSIRRSPRIVGRDDGLLGLRVQRIDPVARRSLPQLALAIDGGEVLQHAADR